MLWGPDNNLDFWTARAAGLVAAPEQRAVSLLAKHSEERRFSLYCRTGQMAAMGNMTKRIYLIRRFAGVLELEDGRPRASWCMNGGGRHRLPESDHVVAMKLMIEGEEYVFRTTGNPSPDFYGHKPRFATPYETSFGGEECPSGPNEDLLSSYALQMQAEAAKTLMKSAFDRARFKLWFHHKLRIQQARHGGRPDREESQKAPSDVANTGQTHFPMATTIPVFGGANGCGIQITGNTAGIFTNTVHLATNQAGFPADIGQWPPEPVNAPRTA